MRDKTAFSAIALSDLEPGAVARVEDVDPDGPLRERLLALGFLPGTRVHRVRTAPLGDPAEYELRGTRLCLRRTEAARIRVSPLEVGRES